MKPLRKQIELTIADRSVMLNVDMRVIEIVESVYDTNVDVVATQILTIPALNQLTKLSAVIQQWLLPGHYQQLGLSRSDVKQAIFGASPDDISRITGCVQAACLYARNYITDEQMERLARGEDLEPQPDQQDDDGDDQDKKKAANVQPTVVQTDSGGVEIPP